MIDHPNKLLEKPKAVWFCNLLEQAAYITNSDTEHLFEEPIPGVYIKGSIKPMVRATDVCYLQVPEPQQLITDYQTILAYEHDIVDKEGEVLIKGIDLKRRKHLFTTQPEMPIAAINVAYNLIMDYVFKYCKYARGIKRSNIEQFIKAEYHEGLDVAYLEDMLCDILDELHEFIKYNDWNIYFHRLRSTTLMLELHCDYRIYNWTEIMYEKQQNELGES